MPTLTELLIVASGLHSTTYGFGETKCGDTHAPIPCAYGALTASGDVFDPDVPTAAIAAPFKLRLRAQTIWLRVPGKACHPIRLNDKLHPRWIGQRGFDLSAAAVRQLTGKPATPYWSGIVEVCK